MANNSIEPPELDLTKDPITEIVDPLRTEVTDKDRFNLAKNILLYCFLLYFIIMGLYALSDSLCIAKGPMKEIWDFSSQGLFGITNLIIGFYFGGKVAGKT